MSDQSGLSIGLTTARRRDGTGWTVETQAGLSDSHLATDWSTRLLGVKVKLGTAISGKGQLSGFVGAEGKVTTNVRGGLLVSGELGGGIVMRLK